jgi:hypothetical protein
LNLKVAGVGSMLPAGVDGLHQQLVLTGPDAEGLLGAAAGERPAVELALKA